MQKLKEHFEKNKIDIVTEIIAAVMMGFVCITLSIGLNETNRDENKSKYVSQEETTYNEIEDDSDFFEEDQGETHITEIESTKPQEPETEVDENGLTYTKMDELLYTTDPLNVRDYPSEDGEVIGFLGEGQKAIVTGRCNETGWYRVAYDGEVGYACDEYMTEECPVAAPKIEAEAAIVMDVETGKVLYEKNPDKKMYPASLTKIMTTLLVCERGGLSEELTFSENCKAVVSDSSVYGVKIGETVTVEDSLYMLMLVSGNDVAVGIAEHISGTEAQFAKLMTKRAKELGADSTNFVNPHGYHNENHYSTARDMMLITAQGLKNPEFVKVWQALEYMVPATNKVSRPTKIQTVHGMLRSDWSQHYEYALGGKTGFHDDAGRCAITTAKKGGRTLLCITLKSDKANQFKDGEKLFEYCFQYK